MHRGGLLAFIVLGLGCATPKDTGGSSPDDAAGGDGDAGFRLDASSHDGPGGFDTPEGGLDLDAACAASRLQADVAPVDLFILLDKSSSMSTKWTPAKSGLTAFLDDPASAGLRVALGFFPRPVDGTPACDQNAYSTPRVPFDDLPKNAAPILTAMAAEMTNGFGTPMYPALGGAILGAAAAVKSRPLGDRGAVLLVTDGEPQGPAPLCGGVNPEDPAVIAGLARAGTTLATPVRTFVIGLPGVNQTIADQIAAAGGTDAAIVISDPTTVEAEFAKALAKVRGASLPCDFPLPPKVKDGEVAFDHVNVEFTKSSGEVVDVIASADCATGEGWHYDDASAPTRIVLCPGTCAAVRGDSHARIDVLLGCKTKIR